MVMVMFRQAEYRRKENKERTTAWESPRPDESGRLLSDELELLGKLSEDAFMAPSGGGTRKVYGCQCSPQDYGTVVACVVDYGGIEGGCAYACVCACAIMSPKNRQFVGWVYIYILIYR